MLINLEKVFPEASKIQDLRNCFIETKEITTTWVDREKTPAEIHIVTLDDNHVIPQLDLGLIDIANIMLNDMTKQAILKMRPEIDKKDFRKKMRIIRELDKGFQLKFS